MEGEKKDGVILEHIKDFEFLVKFDNNGVCSLTMDEPEPLGSNNGPNASKVLAAAVGNCLSASLLFCFQKARVNTSSLKAKVIPEIKRNERGRWRVSSIDVKIETDIEAERESGVSRCLKLFEDFCVITTSLRQGIPVNVKITDIDGSPLEQ